MMKCPGCGGSGIWHFFPSQSGTGEHVRQCCQDCGGTGKIPAPTDEQKASRRAHIAEVYEKNWGAIERRFRAEYEQAGAPYGPWENGSQRWLQEQQDRANGLLPRERGLHPMTPRELAELRAGEREARIEGGLPLPAPVPPEDTWDEAWSEVAREEEA